MNNFSCHFIGAKPSGWSFIFATGVTLIDVAHNADVFDTIAKFQCDDGTNDYYQIAEHDIDAITQWAKHSDVRLLVDCEGEPSGLVDFQPVSEFFDLAELNCDE